MTEFATLEDEARARVETPQVEGVQLTKDIFIPTPSGRTALRLATVPKGSSLIDNLRALIGDEAVDYILDLPAVLSKELLELVLARIAPGLIDVSNPT
ncbi:hypothetical protein [Tsukamurella soli]|uniref:Uncharacterized protein n=1 Tax=Tsukamurella soli TaxID=644556 RepID=A0ABP8K2W8_9ACTN